ncbi:L-2,3-diaminopropanoate--citrate ligase [Paenibacillus plantiphilus]|uniref:L-2,3-diaminopropanoate--citrate ligase n=1 Tax=Paenibacillus plantiphilus TaxID=2905650 RepID=A0ABN8G2K6_9BACL|nr:IucA/IucC family protein [Paenibacillus plantiphilus]CAH1197619.1 L-2,3-diaminopropanoate--citrate ligase [Paenibacillus plantiphilus]
MMDMQEGRNARFIAESEHIGRLLNCYLRERGIPVPEVRAEDDPYAAMPPAILRQLVAEGRLMGIEISTAGVVLIGAAAYISPFGHHKYGQRFWSASLQKPFVYEPLDFEGVVRLIVNEAAAVLSGQEQSSGRIASLLEQIESSMRGMTAYAESRREPRRSLWSLQGAAHTRAAEQSLLFGHPFHPSPKSLSGFADADVGRYAPELGASFPLHYFAAAPGLVREEWLEAPGLLFPAEVTDEAMRLLPMEQRHYRLLPSHPWQAQYLKLQPVVQELLQQGLLVDLGELGEELTATSSIRTVWDFRHPMIYKLPLHVRVTNFIRVNPLEQLKRSVDAGRVLAAVASSIPYSGFHIMLEKGYRTLSLPGDKERSAMLEENFGVIFRQSPIAQSGSDLRQQPHQTQQPQQPQQTGDQEAPAVVASLLERQLSSAHSPLWEAIQAAASARGTAADQALVEQWLERYLSLSLIPLLWLFLERGISMEAHVQNSLVALKEGWPAQFFVRDLEGVSISRSRALEWHPALLVVDSPAYYSDSEAWKRFKYYVLVNHIGHLIHTIAFDGGLDEAALWQIVGKSLSASGFIEQEQHQFYLSDLLNSPTLPAKASLASYFRQLSEKPLYVDIPNPLAAVCVQTAQGGRMR